MSTPTRARNLRKWSKAFIKDRLDWPVPLNPKNNHTGSQIDDPDVSANIANHLQSIGKYVCALDTLLVKFRNLEATWHQEGNFLSNSSVMDV